MKRNYKYRSLRVNVHHRPCKYSQLNLYILKCIVVPTPKIIQYLYDFIGVLLLVLAYTAMGSILFMSFEGEDEEFKAPETAVAASKPYPSTDLINSEIRSR